MVSLVTKSIEEIVSFDVIIYPQYPSNSHFGSVISKSVHIAFRKIPAWRYRPARFCVCKTQRESKREREKGELREREEKSGETEKEEGREWKETEGEKEIEREGVRERSEESESDILRSDC